jgi:hypothetical protein
MVPGPPTSQKLERDRRRACALILCRKWVRPAIILSGEQGLGQKKDEWKPVTFKWKPDGRIPAEPTRRRNVETRSPLVS